MKKGIGLLIIGIALVSALFMNTGCRKEQFGTGSLSFSTDTLTFDTVFTSLGSTTRLFKVFNTDRKAVRISDIQLQHLNGSQEFRILVDGVSGDQFSDIEIPARDSIYVFVEVTVNPNSAATPFVIIDDVSFTANGVTSTVHLQAFGQNAHFHYGDEISGTTTWSNDLPHVVVSHDTVPGVLVKCGGTLNILPGCKVFFAGNSAIFVEGTLRAEATTWPDSIVFQGARLENYYDDKPGQWFGIVFLRDENNVSSCAKGFFDHCIVNESSYGIYAGAGLTSDLNKYLGINARPEVTIKNTIVKNSQYNAVYGFNAKITAENSIFYAAGDNLLKFGLGGEYSFTNCTMYNSGSRYLDHKTETVLLSNFVADGNNTIYPEPIETTFKNCVIYGSLRNEISFNNINDNPFDLAGFDNTFTYSDVKTNEDTFKMFTLVHDSILYNKDPRFENLDEENFAPSDSADYLSPLIDYCPTGTSTDIFDRTRTQKTGPFVIDIGAVDAQ